MRRRGLSEGDREVWAHYVRVVAPLPGVVAPEGAVEPVVAVAPVALAVPEVRRREVAGPLAVGVAPGGLDAASWGRLRTGRLRAERTLDLHGRTAQAAYVALGHFVREASAQGLRCVEVVTGRGRGEGTGVIRREFPLWLNQVPLRGMVLAAVHPHPANPGSVRLLLRRQRG